MKAFHYPGFMIFLLLASGLLVFSAGGSFSEAAESDTWKDLPPLAFSDCVEVDRSMGLNPYSPLPNDFVLVTAYEEKGADYIFKNETGSARKVNVYLITGLLVLEDENVGIPHHSSLVVSVHTTDEDPENETVREWILSDEDNDGRLDKAFFSEVVNNGSEEASTESSDTEIPDDRREELQTYYDQAIEGLHARAEEGSTGESSCIAI